MVKCLEDDISATFSALADPTRRGMLQQLAHAECSVSELAEPWAMSLPAVMKHVRVLERAGLLTHEKSGRVRRCQLNAEPMRDAAEWIARYRVFWTNQLDALASYFESPATNQVADKSRFGKRISSKNRKSKKGAAR